jgi:hypothetical protein
LFYVENSSLPAPKNTPLTLGRTTYYFRAHFAFPTNTTGFRLEATTVVDDGAVLHLNGEEIFRLGMPSGPVACATDAARTVGNAGLEGPFEIATPHLVEGDNVLAVEVHQVNNSSRDVVFGLQLDAVLTITNVVSNLTPIVLNEVLADNATLADGDGVIADWIELFNPSADPVDLTDLSLTDDPARPRRWVFPAGHTLAAGARLVIRCDGSAPASASNTGFGLKTKGGAVFLFDPPARGGGLLDSVQYGLQTADFSLGRVPDGDGAWSLNLPTPGGENLAALLGDPAALRVNEWMANPAGGDDWFELFNPNPQPVALGGLRLSDDLNVRDRFEIHPLSFIGAGAQGYLVFVADGSPGNGPDHVNFRLSAGGESIGLFTADGRLIDGITFGPQAEGVSEGRLPDGAAHIARFPAAASPGRPNSVVPPDQDTDGDGMPDVWESAHGLQPNDPTDAQEDTDGDGLTNLAEFLAGTDPRDATSALAIEAVVTGGANLTLRFQAVAGKRYTVQVRQSLTGGAWQPLADVGPEPVTGTVEVTDPLAGQTATRFYRVLLDPKR